MFNLIGLRFVPILLQIDLFFDTLLSEYMMTAFCPFHKTEMHKKLTQVFESNIRIRHTAQNLEDQFFYLGHGITKRTGLTFDIKRINIKINTTYSLLNQMVFAIIKSLFAMPLRVAVLAAMLNSSLSTDQKWQIGEKHPGGPSK